jgi:putative colanic acid biosynthesis glycosyltransferase
MRFSIITVTKNNLPGLKKTAESVEGQYNHDYEWIVIDGGSNDGTREFLSTTGALWISEPDDGLFDAMNKGLAQARGDYLIFMNAGDSFANTDILHYLRQVIADSGADFLYGDAYETYGEQGAVAYKPARGYSRMAYGMPTHHQAMIYRRHLIEDMTYNTAFPVAADYELTCRAVQRADRVEHVPWAICIFEHGGLSQQKSDQGRREQYHIRKELDLCPAWQNIAITARQWLGNTIRAYTPSLYRRLRYSQRAA